MMTKKTLLTPADIAEIAGVSIADARKLAKTIREEMQKEGAYLIENRKYLYVPTWRVLKKLEMR